MDNNYSGGSLKFTIVAIGVNSNMSKNCRDMNLKINTGLKIKLHGKGKGLKREKIINNLCVRDL